MKTFTLAAALTLTVAAMPPAAAQSDFRYLQQDGGNPWRPQNAFPPSNNNPNAWQPSLPNAGSPWNNNQGAAGGMSPEAFPQNGVAGNGGQTADTDEALQPETLEQTNTTAAPADATTVTAAPAAGAATASTEDPAQATIMVLLPDFLAPTYSGSGSTMVLPGASDSKDGATGSSGKSGEEVKSSAAGGAPLRTAATVLALASVGVAGVLF